MDKKGSFKTIGCAHDYGLYTQCLVTKVNSYRAENSPIHPQQTLLKHWTPIQALSSLIHPPIA